MTSWVGNVFLVLLGQFSKIINAWAAYLISSSKKIKKIILIQNVEIAHKD